MFDRIEHVLKDTEQKYLVDDTFKGHKLLQLVCKECGHAKTREDFFYTLQVEVQNKSNIYESLSAIRDGQIINDYMCDGCNKKVDVQERTLFAQMPNVLVIHE
jgi:ubiquitin C-terminal hydrolase